MMHNLLIGISFTGIGGYVAIQSAINISKGIDSEEWPKVEGEIIETGIQSSWSNKGSLMFTPVVRYRFTYLDKTYVCDNIKVGGVMSTNIRSLAKNTANHFHSKQIVTVSVCPDDPTSSVLEPGMSAASFIAISVGLIFFAIGVKYLLGYFGVELSI